MRRKAYEEFGEIDVYPDVKLGKGALKRTCPWANLDAERRLVPGDSGGNYQCVEDIAPLGYSFADWPRKGI